MKAETHKRNTFQQRTTATKSANQTKATLHGAKNNNIFVGLITIMNQKPNIIELWTGSRLSVPTMDW